MLTDLERNLIAANTKHANPQAKALPPALEGFRALVYENLYMRRTLLADMSPDTDTGESVNPVLDLLARAASVMLGGMQALPMPHAFPDGDAPLSVQCFRLLLVLEQLAHGVGEVVGKKTTPSDAFLSLVSRYPDFWSKNVPQFLNVLDGELLLDAFEDSGEEPETAVATWLKAWVERFVCHRAMCSSLPEGPNKARVAITGFSLRDADFKAWLFYNDADGKRHVKCIGGGGILRDALALLAAGSDAYFPTATRTVVYPAFVALGTLIKEKPRSLLRKVHGVPHPELVLRTKDGGVLRAVFVPDAFFTSELKESLPGEARGAVANCCNLLGVNSLLLLSLMSANNVLALDELLSRHYGEVDPAPVSDLLL